MSTRFDLSLPKIVPPEYFTFVTMLANLVPILESMSPITTPNSQSLLCSVYQRWIA